MRYRPSDVAAQPSTATSDPNAMRRVLEPIQLGPSSRIRTALDPVFRAPLGIGSLGSIRSPTSATTPLAQALCASPTSGSLPQFVTYGEARGKQKTTSRQAYIAARGITDGGGHTSACVVLAARAQQGCRCLGQPPSSGTALCRLAKRGAMSASSRDEKAIRMSLSPKAITPIP